MALRGIRGATSLRADDAEEMREAVTELLERMIEANSIDTDSLVSIILTATPDLVCAFPAASARRLGLTDVPLLCAQEIDVAGAMPRVVRVLMHADIDTPRSAVQHAYLRGTDALRRDP